jgi:uncharacterized membrane protein
VAGDGSRVRGNLLIKAIIYRLLAFSITLTIAYIFTRGIELSVGIAIVELIGKTLLYWIFDVLWEKSSGSLVSQTVARLQSLGLSAKRLIARYWTEMRSVSHPSRRD